MRFPGGEVLIGYGYDAWGFLGAALLATASSLYALRLQAEAAAKER